MGRMLVTKFLQAFLLYYFALLALGPSAVAAPVSFQLADDSAGATCSNFSNMGSLAWTRRGGDWVDAANHPYGPQSFDTQSILLGHGRPFTEWNVTELVRGWLTDRFHNDGMLLRAEKGELNGVIDFHSRESADLTSTPVLKLKWADGSRARLSPDADTYLDCSSITSLGNQKIFKVGGNQSALLRFSLKPRKANLEQAALMLVSDKQYGNGSKIGVYRVSPPYARSSTSVDQGLASGFVGDVGIETDPDVIFATGFENPFWITEWNWYSPFSNAETVLDDSARQFRQFQGKALRVRLVKGSNFGLDLRYTFDRKNEPEPDEIFFRYYLRFGNDWDPYLDGGKMPGIAGTDGRAGWGMRKSDGYNGWSVRGAFAARLAAAKSVKGLTTLGSYVYHVDIDDSSGEYWGWNHGPSGIVENNKWYSIEQHVKLNTPGKRDGVFRVWLDGRQVFERTNIRFRYVPTLKIESVWLDVYHGGVAPSPKNMTLYIDNVVISKKYIGPASR